MQKFRPVQCTIWTVDWFSISDSSKKKKKKEGEEEERVVRIDMNLRNAFNQHWFNIFKNVDGSVLVDPEHWTLNIKHMQSAIICKANSRLIVPHFQQTDIEIVFRSMIKSSGWMWTPQNLWDNPLNSNLKWNMNFGRGFYFPQSW